MRLLAVEPQVVLRLVLANWCVELGPVVVGCKAGGPGPSVDLLMGRADSWPRWLSGLEFPKFGFIPLVSGAGSQGIWLSPKCLGAGISLLVGRTMAQGVLGLVPAHCWVSLAPGLVLAHWWAELGPGVSGYRTLGAAELVPAHWYVGLVLSPLVDRGGRCGLSGS